MAQQIIVKGELDWSPDDRAYLIKTGHGVHFLSSYIDQYIGQALVISLEEPSQGDSEEEEELEPAINERLKKVLVEA